MSKTKIAAGTEGVFYKGRLCDVSKVSGGWSSITDWDGRACKVRNGELTLSPLTAADVVTIAKGDAVANRQELSRPAVEIPNIQVQTRSNTMATRKNKKAPKAKANGNGNGHAVRKLGDSEFKNFDKYVSNTTASGNKSYDSGDAVAAKLRGLSIGDVYDTAAAKLGVSVRTLKDKYSHLNLGMQRMNLANRMRGVGKAKSATA